MSQKREENIRNDVLATMSSKKDLQRAVAELERRGFKPEAIRLFHPDEAPERLDPSGEHAGIFDRIAKSIEGALSDQYKLLEEYAEAAKGGMEVIAVHVHKPEELETAKEILESHNGENIRHFGSWAVTDLQAQGRATS